MHRVSFPAGVDGNLPMNDQNAQGHHGIVYDFLFASVLEQAGARFMTAKTGHHDEGVGILEREFPVLFTSADADMSVADFACATQGDDAAVDFDVWMRIVVETDSCLGDGQ